MAGRAAITMPSRSRGLAATEAVNLLQGEFAHTIDFGEQLAALAQCGRTDGGPVHRACRRRGSADPARQARGAALDAQITAVFSAAMPAETLQDPRRQMPVAARSHPQIGDESGTFSARTEGFERRPGPRFQDPDRRLELSRRLSRFESDGTEPGNGIAVLPVHHQPGLSNDTSKSDSCSVGKSMNSIYTSANQKI